MNYMSKQLESIFQISRTFSIMSRRFDAGLGGISLNECIILSSLLQAPENKMRRIDLAEKIGFTPSGITRLLLPMEKIGLVLREKNEHDARVSYVILAPGWKQKVLEAIERAEYIISDLLPGYTVTKANDIVKILQEITQWLK